jgi:hypothetical protein
VRPLAIPALAAAALAAAALCAGAGASRAQGGGRAVDLELVLAIDTSTSVDAQEFHLQRQGLADAFMHRDVVRAIRGAGELGIAVTLVEWAGEHRQATVVGWTHVHDGASAAALAARIRAAPRAMAGLTDIAGAIRYAVAAIEANAFEGYRLAIDVSGDGSSDAQRCERERDRAVARGITVNGLVIYSDDVDLGELANTDVREHYANHVIGGAGAFMMTADDFSDFAAAIRRKLVREIAGPATAELSVP